MNKLSSLLTFVFTLSLLTSCGPTAAAPIATPVLRTVTIAQTDAGTVNVWDNYQTRKTVVARVQPGVKVQLVRQEGRGVLIRTSGGVEGWVTDHFIAELRQ
jgi:SH3-like domain-containing protein